MPPKSTPSRAPVLRATHFPSSLIFRTAGVSTAIGLALVIGILVTGRYDWAVFFFQYPAAVLVICFAALGCWQSAHVCRHFARGEVLHNAWVLVAFSGACEAGGNVLVQFFSGELRDLGHIVAGTVRFALLAGGFYFGLMAYRRADFLGRLKWSDYALIGGATLYVLVETVLTADAFRYGKKTNAAEVFLWPVDPLLCFLLAESLRLLRSTQRMGQSLIARTWRAFVVGLSLTVVGDVTIWLLDYHLLKWPWNSLTWCIWLPATAAFALAPTYQLEAIESVDR